MEAIPISEKTLNQFRGNYETDNDNTEPINQEDPEALQQLNEVANWLLKTADNALATYTENLGGTPEDVEKVRWDEESRKVASELSVLVARRNISNDILKNSPEMFLGTILVGKIVEVGIVTSQIKKRQPEPKKQEDE